ncbi:hypothetical protein [Pseudomonas sp. StFLB209]|uniref:hypothetical protein n=1 Tax=Pseudomonas sp. StFLB209 TaxID=1028989 RepID=UPI001186256D|nr:hypothetical protein [Pseudomonas sp. StFLB209]
MQTFQSSQTTILVKEVEKAVSKIGIMFRLFYREKTTESLSKKATKVPGKYGKEKKSKTLLESALHYIS